jgi:hypothetical protein
MQLETFQPASPALRFVYRVPGRNRKGCLKRRKVANNDESIYDHSRKKSCNILYPALLLSPFPTASLRGGVSSESDGATQRESQTARNDWGQRTDSEFASRKPTVSSDDGVRTKKFKDQTKDDKVCVRCTKRRRDR